MLPPIKIGGIGYGAGSRDPKSFPNALRLIVGQLERGTERDEQILVLETNIDDMNPQAYGYVMERAFGLGALDVFMVPVQMKKGRPGLWLVVIAPPESADLLARTILTETTTLGVRVREERRYELHRRAEEVETPFG